MTRDDIIRMAVEAGFIGVRHQPLFSEMLEDFARAAYAAGAAAEREECAKVCDSFGRRGMHPAECAAAIRARGQA